MAKETKIPTCPDCGSHDITLIADVAWDRESGGWAIVGVTGQKPHCWDCGRQVKGYAIWKDANNETA